jgi:hypothetical protein
VAHGATNALDEDGDDVFGSAENKGEDAASSDAARTAPGEFPEPPKQDDSGSFDMPAEFFDAHIEVHEAEWPEDPAIELAWDEGKARRDTVKVTGWGLILAASVGVVLLVSSSAPRESILYWATMGQLGEGSDAARAVHTNARAERLALPRE